MFKKMDSALKKNDAARAKILKEAFNKVKNL